MVLDFETRSRCDLREHGASVYAEDASTEVLCLAWSSDHGGTVGLWEPSQGKACPPEIVAHLNAGGAFEAHNAEFEQAIWEYVCVGRMAWPPIPDDRWRDSMARVAAWALPLSLAGSSKALGLASQKDEEGSKIMLRLCKPRKPSKNDAREWFDDPEDFKRLYEYCRQDVRAEAGLAAAVPDLSEPEAAVWAAHNRMNRRGIQVDTKGAAGAIRMLALGEAHIAATVSAATDGAITGDDLYRPAHVVKWIEGRGISMAAFRKGDVVEALALPGLPADVRAVLEARQSLGRTSTAKFQAMLDRANSDGRVRGTLVYHGATTGRWVGRGFQPQNLPRAGADNVDELLADMAALTAEAFLSKHGDPFAAAVGCLRGCIIAAPGNSLVAADYAQIEARVLFWLAGDRQALEAFRSGRDIYREMAAIIYGKPADQITKAERQVGKFAILGLGFGMGGSKFYQTCATMGQPVEAELAERAVKAYRAEYPLVKALWNATEDAAVQAVNAPETTFANGRCAWRLVGKHLFCKLPSGRKLCYPFAELGERKTPWGEMRECVTFKGESPFSRQWEASDTYGGKLVENVVQAVARDLLAAALVRVDRLTPHWLPVFMCHDELVCEVPGAPSEAKARELEGLICELPTWASGLPVAAEGFAASRYRK